MHLPGRLQATKEELRPVAPPYAYAAISLSNVVATFCQYEALKHVSFPVQTLGKCAKMIPVMIWCAGGAPPPVPPAPGDFRESRLFDAKLESFAGGAGEPGCGRGAG